MRKLLTLLLLVMGSSGMWAQLTYLPSLVSNTTNPGGINTESETTTTGWTEIQAAAQSTNVLSAAQAIGFPFDFYGTPVTHFKASLNGVITFDTATVVIPGANTNLPSAGLPDMSVAGLWDEFTSSAPTGGNDRVYTKTFGTAGSQQMWIKWFSFEYGNPNVSFAYFCIVLEEGTNNVHIVDLYGSATPSLSRTIGVQMDGTTAVQFGTDQNAQEGNGTSLSDNEVWTFAPFVPAPFNIYAISATSSAIDNSCNGTTETVTIQIGNLGTNPATGIGGAFSVDGGPATTPELIPGTLNPGDTLTYTFTATADLSAGGAHTIDAGATVLNDADLSNDTTTLVVSTANVIAAPFVEDFENAGNLPADWSTSANTTFLWLVDENGTGSSGTGPSDDHSDPGTYYVYTEASSGSAGFIDELFSPCIDLSALTAPRLGYWYHMFGNTMGNLYVDVIANGVRTRIDSIIGQQQTANADPFLERVLSLDAYIGQTIQLAFVGQSAGTFAGDMAIDDVSIFQAAAIEIAATSVAITSVLDCSNSAAASVAVSVANLGLNDITGVSVSLIVDGGTPTVETIGGTLLSGDDTTYVFLATADLSAAGLHTIDATATATGDTNTLNDSTSTTTTSPGSVTAPFVEGFENAGNLPAGWSFDSPTNFNWTVDENGTGSSGTGPSDDHSDPGTYYVYTEASSGASGDITELISPCIDLSPVSSPKLRYWYHMFGSAMGTLYVDAEVNGVRTRLDSIVGQQQTANADPFRERVVDLSAYSGQTIQLIFVGKSAGTFAGDMAIDDVEIFQPPAFDLELTSLDITNGCGLSAAEQVMITVTNAGTDTLMSASAQFSVDAGAYTAVETITGPMAPGASVNYTFTATADLSAIGPHTIDAVATAAAPADLNTANDSVSATSENVMLVSPAYPYQENFDSGAAGWMASGANSTWVLTTPNKAIIDTSASAPNSWVNGDTTGIYSPDENSFVTSPCIDMTNAPMGSWVSLKVWWESEFSWDGAALQVSSDAGSTWSTIGNSGDPFNWYTDNTINGNPGGQQQGWTGTGASGSGGWVLAAHPLDTALIGQASVRFRIAFGSDGSVQEDGFAFDDFTISAAPTLNLGDSLLVCGTAMLDGGNPGATYDWSNGDSTQTLNIMNMTGMNIIDSTLTLTVTDSFGLSVTDDVVLTIPASIPSGMAMVSDSILCNGDSTGSIMVNAMGGTAPYAYTWSTMDSSNMAIGLPAGSYNVTVSDSFGCSFDAAAMISEPAAIGVALDSLVDVSCPDDSTGMITISVSGGTGAYTFSWSNGDTSEDLMMLPVGDYTGVITDANGCTLTSPTLTIAATDTFPVAAFDYVPGDVNYEITFSDMSTDATSIMWDFGDGNTSTDATPTYAFATNDTFIVSLTATNDCGTSTKTDTIIVTNVSIEDDLLSQAVQVYPNPNSGNFEVEFAGITLDNVVLRVSNTAGQMIYTRNIGQVRGKLTQAVSLPSTLAAGLYILEVRTPNAVMHKRLIVE
ncbi:MAG: PKD domain-containing protein [Bacteroidia bacterium]